MTDADLIYNACLRAERKMEERMSGLDSDGEAFAELCTMQATIRCLREEIGNGLSEESR